MSKQQEEVERRIKNGFRPSFVMRDTVRNQLRQWGFDAVDADTASSPGLRVQLNPDTAVNMVFTVAR